MPDPMQIIDGKPGFTVRGGWGGLTASPGGSGHIEGARD
jgi:hypothetical protein